MPRTLIASSAFTQADGVLDAGSWLQLDVTDGGNARVTTNKCTAITAAQTASPFHIAAARWAGAGTFTDDQYASIVVDSFSTLNQAYRIGVCVRASVDQDGARDMYEASVASEAASGGNQTTFLRKVVNGTVTTLHSATVVWTNLDRIELEVEGTTLRLMKNGTALGGSFTQTDTALTTGKPGVIAGGGTITGDDWEGGNMGAAPTNDIIVVCMG